MQKQYLALSIVAPSGTKIAQGIKTLEIRRWKPQDLPLRDLMIVENTHYLNREGDEDIGQAVALVDIESVHAWQKDEVEAACATTWVDGYWAWVLSNIRPIDLPFTVPAKRKIYAIEVSCSQ